ncbi:hypothetical protein ACH5RR_008492 [Cinchona calisaya]|uniref:Rhodanese domain-containing protein n=1 Tax=Cinchona calisaya TaxID=153742 RepID=A0ABD3AFD5_9GENT
MSSCIMLAFHGHRFIKRKSQRKFDNIEQHADDYKFTTPLSDLTPAQTLDLMSTKNYSLIEIRSEKDKDKAGVPRLPSNAKNNIIAIPLEELTTKFRSLVRSVKKVDAELVALKISYLKKINKGSNIVIMDSYSDTAKIVARTLTNLGFKNTGLWLMASQEAKGGYKVN